MNTDDKLKLVDPNCSQLSVSRQCRVLNLSRSRFYYKPKVIDEVELEQMRILDELYLEDPTRGTRRMSKELKKLGYQCGRHHTRTLMQRMRLKTVYCRPRTTIIDKTSYKYPYLLRNLKVNRVNQVWAVDITYVPMEKGFLYLFAIMDLRSRCIVGWSLSNTMEADWVISTLKQAIAQHGKPEIINSDQGSQFTSKDYVDYIKSLESTKISMDGKGRAIDNVFIERFWRTIKYDKLYLYTIENGHHALELCEEFMEYYNHKRMHSSIDDKTPMQLYKEAA